MGILLRALHQNQLAWRGAVLLCLSSLALFAFPLFSLAAEAAPDPVSGFFNVAGTGLLAVVLGPVAIVAWTIFKIGSFLLGIAGILFNWTMAILVFRFGEHLGNSEGMLLAWGILRDFANIGLLFGFIFLGIATILDLHSYPWKKTLPTLIIYAVLLNFSLFITEAIIDSANVLASTLYNVTNDGSSCGGASWLDCAIDTGVAGQILEATQITTIFDTSTPAEFFADATRAITDPLGNVLRYIGLALLVTIAAVVLFAGAIMLISRAVVLAFLMVTSPIGFAGLAIPGLQKLAKEWWSKLINQAFFAPVFLLLLYVGLKLTEGLGVLANANGGLANAIQGRSIDTGPLLLFALVIAFMIGALMLANKFGIYASDFAIRAAGGAVYGSIGWVGRRTIGAASNRLATNIRKSSFGTTIPGKMLAGVYDIGAKSSTDVRGLAPFGALTKGLKVDMGKTSDIGKKGRAGELENEGKKAYEASKAVKKAWEVEDKGYDQKSKDLQRSADLARANGDEESATIFERQKTQNEADKKENQLKRLGTAQVGSVDLSWLKNDDDRVLQEYYDRTGREAKDGESAAKTASEDAARDMSAAADAMKESARIIAEMERQRRATEDPAAIERINREIELQQERSRDYAAQNEEARERKRRADQRQQVMQKRKELMQSRAEDLLKPKQSMEQMARAFSQTAQIARTPIINVVLDRAKLERGAYDIREEAHKDPKQAALEHFLHEVEHGSHGTGRERGHAEEEHHTPAAPTHAPTPGGTHPPP